MNIFLYNMNTKNYKLLIHNLRKGKNATLKIKTTASTVKYVKVRESVSIQKIESNNS